MSANMFSQRLVQFSVRRLAASNPSTFTKTFARLPAPAAVATGRLVQQRFAATTPVSNEEGYSILAAQRRNRPVSPHLTIYKPQITWIPSMFNRITGVTLSGGFYIFGMAYLVAPLIGWHLDSHSLAAAFAAWPIILKVLAKFIVAMPFTFHSFNGLRHLVWDTGRQFTNRQVAITGWMAIGVSVVTAVGLTFY